MTLILDLETGPHPDTLALEPDEEWLQSGVRDNFKSETAQRYREENRAAWPAERIRLGSLDWRLGQIIAGGTMGVEVGAPTVRIWILKPPAPIAVTAIGWGVPEERQDQVSDAFPDLMLLGAVMEDEADILMGLRHQLAGGTERPVVGFGLRNFDLPWLLGRGAVNRVGRMPVAAGSRYDLSPRAPSVDWQDVLHWYGALPSAGWTLARYAQHFALPVQPWGEGVRCWEHWKVGDVGYVGGHLLMDLLTTACLHHRFAHTFLRLECGE